MKTSSRWHVGVIIPARNEEDLLPRCLHSILDATAKLRNLATAQTVVIADSCTDRTLALARKILARKGTVLSSAVGAVGAARRQATHELLKSYRGPLNRCWIASTDADCVVPPTWLADQLALAEMGIDAVAGTVSVDAFDEHGPQVRSRFKASYATFPDGSHPHVHGANMGIRADAYLRAGGWDSLPTAEDHDLWNRLSISGARKHSTCGIEVVTSGRRIGRAPHGFAEALAAHNEPAA